MKYGPQINSETSGMKMFAGETEENIKILIVLVGILLFFCLFVLIANMLMKIDGNLRVYLIQMMNGASIWHIIWQYILEILMVCIPACIICMLLMRYQLSYNINFLIAILIVSVLSILISAIIVAMKLANLKTDELLRRKE